MSITRDIMASSFSRLVSSSCSGIPGRLYKTPETDFHEVYKNNMDENSCLPSKNVIPTVVKNKKTTGLISQAGGRSTEEYLKCQVDFYTKRVCMCIKILIETFF